MCWQAFTRRHQHHKRLSLHQQLVYISHLCRYLVARPHLVKQLCIERPKFRNGQTIANQNTLIYVLINLRALHRVQLKKAARDFTG